MVRSAILNLHWTWADWVGIGLGLLIALTPLFAGLPENEALVLRSAQADDAWIWAQSFCQELTLDNKATHWCS